MPASGLGVRICFLNDNSTIHQLRVHGKIPHLSFVDWYLGRYSCGVWKVILNTLSYYPHLIIAGSLIHCILVLMGRSQAHISLYESYVQLAMVLRCDTV